MDFIFKLHMLNSPFQVQPFKISLALGLISITFFDWLFLWGSFLLHKKEGYLIKVKPLEGRL